ncbi:phosphate signaling complex protein PhoU [Streptococcus uberis]|uniref:Phosphate-specific transport system accessory protein PhoU n=1 Tax=Streptococcus uberis (strain ATCC BAA-854 / 0140J) TaxID=218495 RepID=B9DRI9_STRU0|nr:phosphate signaling complex protein PhoU [Streptococcus uberis]KHD41305.1 PhoU family transcriptional regulator [Streptococcus hongkongensis]KKF42645.1 PhoU family transcriptional regulator [Streptococcus uberis C9359]KKF43657.1 PhoU family transcriptional regulator [Streptococcus uberis EF20/0145]KKF44666.1 PhoU family transcriptional regulator [Streptococcus uberis Ab71]KKF46381.1 PhoU family transcriptional regulator [Streptococcus uberis C8329]
MRDQFELELQELEQKFLEMGSAVLESASKVLLALAAKDTDMAELIIKEDKLINQAQLDIELTCANLLALQQPQVTDLRFVLTIMSACSDLERMGDHMTGIAKAILNLKEIDTLDVIEEHIHDAGQKALKMMSDLLLVFPKRNADKAIAIANQDEAIDQLYYSISKEILTVMKEQETSVRNGAQYLYMMGHIERFGDYISNICERIVYLETGELVELN